MSHDAKRLKTDSATDGNNDEASAAPYELVYWPGLPGRGEPIRLLFIESGTPYIDRAKDDAGAAVSEIRALVDLSSVGDDTNPPIFAPPILKHGDLVLHQLPSILLYLAPRLGLGPKEGHGVYHLNQIVLTILDGFVNELHDTHHPIDVAAHYEEQKEPAKARAKAFRTARVPKYLAYVQRLLDSKTSGDGPWLYGDKLTYADLVLYQSIHGTEYAFPKTFKALRESGKYHGVFKLVDAVAVRPNIKSYMESDKRAAYANGIWRHYAELEEE